MFYLKFVFYNVFWVLRGVFYSDFVWRDYLVFFKGGFLRIMMEFSEFIVYRLFD